MSNTCETLRNLNNGRTDWRVKVRIIRQWKGVSNTGEPFKGFNLILLDAKNCRMAAYVPAAVEDRIGRSIELGKIYMLKNFEVKTYTEQDKYRPVQIDRKIAFTKETKVIDVDESQMFIPKNMFDFFQFSDLKHFDAQHLHLADVIGIIRKKEKLNNFINRNGKAQTNIKFKLSDGSKNINVTFWDSFAIKFADSLTDELEEPIILIIASGRVTSWNDQIDICNYSPTNFYINYDHHSVHQLRKMLKEPNFYKHNFYNKRKTFKLCTVAEIKNLGEEFIQDEVICKTTIRSVKENNDWKYCVCTSCYAHVVMDGESYFCQSCKRKVPEPTTKFNIAVVALDNTGELEIYLNDRVVRTLLGDTNFDIEQEDVQFPQAINSIQGKGYTLKILIQKENVDKGNNAYLATDIMLGFDYEELIIEEQPSTQNTESLTAEPSSSYHLDDISQLNYIPN